MYLSVCPCISIHTEIGPHPTLPTTPTPILIYLSIYLPIRLNPRGGHQTGSGEPSAGGYFFFFLCAMLVVLVVSERSQCLPYNAEPQARKTLVPFLMPLVWQGRVSNLWPPTPEADALPLELSLPYTASILLKLDRNDLGPKRSRAETTHLLRPKRPTPKIGRNDPDSNTGTPRLHIIISISWWNNHETKIKIPIYIKVCIPLF